MFLVIAAIIINGANAQVAAPIQSSSSELSNQRNQNNQNSAAKNYGNTIREEYTDSDGNTKSRAYRYGFQYNDSFKPVKPVGGSSKESYTNQSGDQGARSYKYGWQYKSDEASDEKPIKLKAPKWSAPTESTGENAGSSVSSDTSPSSSSSTATPSVAPPSASTSSPTPASDEAKKKDTDILNRMKDLIQERQKLKSGNSL